MYISIQNKSSLFDTLVYSPSTIFIHTIEIYGILTNEQENYSYPLLHAWVSIPAAQERVQEKAAIFTNVILITHSIIIGSSDIDLPFTSLLVPYSVSEC